MAEDYIDSIISQIRSMAMNDLVSTADEESGAAPPWHGQPPADRRVKSGTGWVDAAGEALKRGGETFGQEITAPIRDIPEGIRTSTEALQEDDPTVLGRLRRAGTFGLGAAQAGLSIARPVFAPITAAARTATEFPLLLAEKPGEERDPFAEKARMTAQIALELAGGLKAPSVIARLRGLGAARAAGEAVPVAEAAASAAGPVEAAAAGPIEDARRLPGIGETYEPPSRVFKAGPPGSVTGKPTQAYEPGLVDPETGQVVRGAKPQVPEPPGGVPPVVERKPGETMLDALRRQQREASGMPETAVDQTIAEGMAAKQPEETLGQSIRRQIRERQGRVVDETPGEPDVTTKGMSLGDRVKLVDKGEQAKVIDAAKNLTQDELDGAPSRIRDAVRNNMPEDVADRPGWLTGGARDWFTWFKTKLPLSMTQVAKGDPEFTQLVKTLKSATDEEHALAERWTIRLNDIAKEAGGPKQLEEIVKAIDQKLPLTPTQGQTATKFRELFDEVAQANSLDPAHPLYKAGYVPHLRNLVKLVKTKLVSTDEWVSADTLKSFPSHFRPYYTKARKLMLPGEKYDIESLTGHLRAAARGSVWGTPIHEGVLKDIEPILGKLSDRPDWMQDFVGNYVNYVIGHPSFRSSEGMQKLGNAIRTTEFMRTIVGNVTSPIYNTFQRVLTVSEVSVKAAVKAALDEVRWLRGDPEAMRIVREAQIPLESLGPHKLDTEAFIGGRFKQILTKLKDIGAAPFGFAERQNRVYTLFAGYHDAIAKGATEAEAIQAGKNLIQKTQFTPGPTDRPQWMRGEVGSTIGQFKYFQTKMGEYITNNFTDMFAKGATPTERLAAANKFVKFWGSTYALGGSTMLPIPGDWLEKHDPIAWKGALPYIGMAVHDQLGMGGILPKDVKSLTYYIPGPALSHARDLMTAAGMDPLNPTAIPSLSARVRGATRSIPIAGVQLERLRRGGIVGPDFTEREPQTVGEAIPIWAGGQGIPPNRPLLARDVSPIGRMIGVQDPEQEKTFNLMDEFNRAVVIKNRALADAAQAKSVGDTEGAYKILRDAEKDLGIPLGRLKISPQSGKAAKEASKMTPLERRRKAGGKALRDYGEEDNLP